MAFEELLVQERLLKAGDLLRFEGSWGVPYANNLFRIGQAHNTRRVRLVALSDVDVETVIDIDVIGLNPEIALWAYEIRLGVGQGLVKIYLRWPSNDFTRQLQDPNFQINPANADLKLIGFSDHISSPFEDPRFRMFWVKDQLPSFVALADAGAVATPMFQKVRINVIVNILGLIEETDAAVIADVESGKLFVSSAQHYELQGNRAVFG